MTEIAIQIGTDRMEGANGVATARQLKKVMVFCDGTWCGQLTGTQTNVKILADSIAGRSVNAKEPFESSRGWGEIVGCYFAGEGVEGDFSDYLMDGALGGRIKEDCKDVYKFLMDQFEEMDGACEAWLIGLSRGSYTIRCVAGMINNCGIVSRTVIANRLGATPFLPSDVDVILERAYMYYRDRTKSYLPTSKYMQEWRRGHSRETRRPPVKFLGLFETVGALGIPSLNPGMGVDYLGDLNFYGKADEGVSAVSGEVERVYQALAVHDRLTVFSPCHVKRDKFPRDFAYNKGSEEPRLKFEYVTEELWFPGAHYDIGRQKFMFYKSPKLFTPDLKTDLTQLKLRKLVREISKRLVQSTLSFGLTRLLRIPDIHPNYEFSAAVIKWMTTNMASTDRAFNALRDEVVTSASVVHQTSWKQTLFNWLTFKPSPLSSDAYDHLIEAKYITLSLAPFAHRFLVGLMDRYLLKDRFIVDPPPDPSTPPAPPVKFYLANQTRGGHSDSELRASRDYRSRSYSSYMLDKTIMESRV